MTRREFIGGAVACAAIPHIDVADRISPTAKEYVVGGNFLFRGREALLT